MKTLNALIAVIALAGLMPAAFAQDAADKDSPDKGEHCIPLMRIDRTEILDDSHIVFHMRGADKIYMNTLRQRCPGLRPNDVLMYRALSSQLCDIDIATVLENRGFGFMPGVSCVLGSFKPIDKGTYEDFKADLKKQRN